MASGRNSITSNDLRYRVRSVSSLFTAALRLHPTWAVVFHEASARRFGPGRADVVHYFLSGTTMSPRQKDQLKIEGRPVWA
ncbi:MAG TPA: hypothetical protein VKD23_01880, partial [Terriglobales bacterium]|nr:hypothetical protein [Terriglobales bacterium]